MSIAFTCLLETEMLLNFPSLDDSFGRPVSFFNERRVYNALVCSATCVCVHIMSWLSRQVELVIWTRTTVYWQLGTDGTYPGMIATTCWTRRQIVINSTFELWFCTEAVISKLQIEKINVTRKKLATAQHLCNEPRRRRPDSGRCDEKEENYKYRNRAENIVEGKSIDAAGNVDEEQNSLIPGARGNISNPEQFISYLQSYLIQKISFSYPPNILTIFSLCVNKPSFLFVIFFL